MVEHREHLVAVGCRNAHEQAATLDWRNQPRSAVGAKYDAQIGHIGLHSPSECGVRISREGVGFVDDDHYHKVITRVLGGGAENSTFEPVPRAQVDLLGLRDFFDNFLNHDSVIVSNFTAWEKNQSNGTPHPCTCEVR